ncbi:MAG TPA: hypothetical protein VFZ56_03940 [Gemmatimonadaceae bacterium]
MAKNTELYCSAKLLDNANKDGSKLRTYAEWGWWTEADGLADGAASHENVAYIAAKMIANNEANLAAGKVCGGADAALVEELSFLINLFANQTGGEFTDNDITAFVCPTGGCTETGPGWKVNIPNGAFNNPVIVMVQPNGGAFPGPERQVGNSWKFDVLPVATANFPWTRYICWEGDVAGADEGDVDPTYIVVVRENADETLDYLPTIVEDWGFGTCTQYQAQASLLNSAYKLLAGLPLFPKALDAYSPPRTFGGTSTAASPHWLAVVPPSVPEDPDLAALCAKTTNYSPSTANAACRHLDRAEECAEGDTACYNGAIDSFINVVSAQSGKGDLTTAEADDLIDDAEALKITP